MTERRYTDENDQPLDANLINGPDFIRAVTDLTHGDTTISAALELIRKHPNHSHSFPTNTGLIVHIPALTPRTTEEDIDALVEEMLATLKNDLLEEIDNAEPTDG